MSQINQLFFLVLLLCAACFVTIRELAKLDKRVFDLQERIELLEKR